MLAMYSNLLSLPFPKLYTLTSQPKEPDADVRTYSLSHFKRSARGASCRFRSWISAASRRASSTPVGTVLYWSDGGVSYTLAGSVPAAERREAARGLLAR